MCAPNSTDIYSCTCNSAEVNATYTGVSSPPQACPTSLRTISTLVGRIRALNLAFDSGVGYSV